MVVFVLVMRCVVPLPVPVSGQSDRIAIEEHVRRRPLPGSTVLGYDTPGTGVAGVLPRLAREGLMRFGHVPGRAARTGRQDE